MLKYLRYALATFCFAASVGCLALWGWSLQNDRNSLKASHYSADINYHFKVFDGVLYLMPRRNPPGAIINGGWQFQSTVVDDALQSLYETLIAENGSFGRANASAFIPLWYPALIFALTGVASLRLGRRFTIRSAIIATTVVAGLLGMAVIL